MCKLKEDGSFTNGGCHSIVDLGDFGITGLSGKGCIADMKWIASIKVPCHISKTDKSYLLDLPYRKVQSVVELENGIHGVIEGGLRTTGKRVEQVMIKRAKVIGFTLLHEALIQYVVHRSLVRGGFPKGAAKVYDIIGLESGTVCFTMEPMKGINLQALLEASVGFKFSTLVIEAIVHISAMLCYIMNDIGMNHRDLKPNNIIIIERDTPVDIELSVGKLHFTLTSHFEISFIDFGFSCIGIEGGKGGGSLRAGKVYDDEDPCPKEGRDMYMFLCFLYFYTHRKLSREMDGLFKKWLNVGDCSMTDFLKSAVTLKEKREIMDWIYKITGNPHVIRLQTTPESIVRDLMGR